MGIEDFKLETFDNCLNKLESLFNDKINKLEQALENKSDVINIDNIHTKLNRIEQQQLEQESKNLMQESYNKDRTYLFIDLKKATKQTGKHMKVCRKLYMNFSKKASKSKNLEP